MITWTPVHGTGNSALDDQHKNLFFFVNELEKSLDEHRGLPWFKMTFQFLESYIKNHFEDEEDCMFYSVCSAAQSNKEAHDRFIEKVQAVKAQLNTGDLIESDLRNFHTFLEKWVQGHILCIDTKLNAPGS